MHRSGTSATARVLSLLGLQLPENGMGPTPSNQFGHWGESIPIYALHEKLLADAGSAWDDVSPFPAAWLHSSAGREYQAKLTRTVKEEYPGSAPFAIKDPRICRLLPMWLGVLDALDVRPAFVICVRNPIEVAASLAKRDGFSNSKGLLLWLRHMLDAERHTREQPRAFVSYADLLRDWDSAMQLVSKGIDVSWPRTGHLVRTEIEKFLSAEHRHHEASTQELNARADVVDWVKETWALLLDACSSEASLDPSRLDALRAMLDDADLAYGPLLAESQLVASELRRSAEEQRTHLESERRDLSERLDAREADLEEVRMRLQARDESVTALEADLSRLQAEWEELSERVHAEEAERLRVDAELGSLSEQLRARETELAAARSQVQEREESGTALNHQLAALRIRDRSWLSSSLHWSRSGPGSCPNEPSRSLRAPS